MGKDESQIIADICLSKIRKASLELTACKMTLNMLLNLQKNCRNSQHSLYCILLKRGINGRYPPKYNDTIEEKKTSVDVQVYSLTSNSTQEVSKDS